MNLADKSAGEGRGLTISARSDSAKSEGGCDDDALNRHRTKGFLKQSLHKRFFNVAPASGSIRSNKRISKVRWDIQE